MNLIFFILIVTESVHSNGFSLYSPEDCADFTVGDCAVSPDSIIQQFPTDDVPMCQEVCRQLSSCMLFSHDGLICSLLDKEYRKGCGTVGAPVEADMDKCEDAIVESCSGFDEENCEYLGESVGVDPPNGQISDPLVCQKMCETFSGLGCNFWVFKDKEQSCQLLKSSDRSCSGISGPRAPPIEECRSSTPTQQPHTSTQNPDKDDWTATVWLNDDGTEIVTNVGEEAFNSYFAQCPVVQYTRNDAVYAVYKRTSPIPPSFNAFKIFTTHWASSNNQLNVDFKLYDNFEDAKGDVGAWAYCNYDGNVGFPRDCGKAGKVVFKWFSIPGGGGDSMHDVFNGSGFHIYTGSVCPV